MLDREQAIQAAMTARIGRGGPHLQRGEAEAVVDAILAVPDPELDRLREQLDSAYKTLGEVVLKDPLEALDAVKQALQGAMPPSASPR